MVTTMTVRRSFAVSGICLITGKTPGSIKAFEAASPNRRLYEDHEKIYLQ